MMRLAALLLMLSFPVHAQTHPNCTDNLKGFEQGLKGKYQEHLVAQGVDAGGRLVKLYVSNAGTWTIIIVLTESYACLTGSGDGWAFLRAPGEAS